MCVKRLNCIRYSKIKLLGLFLLLVSTFSWGLKSDESQPIVITAKEATADQINKQTVFTGQVIATQGSMVVHADQATATEDAVGNKTIHLIGKPVSFVQLNEDGEKTEGQCNDFKYFTQNNMAELTGNAIVKKGGDLVKGDLLTYNTQTQIYSAVSRNANGVSSKVKSGRVTVILQPKGNNGNLK